MMQTMDANHWWFLHIFFQSYHDKDSFFIYWRYGIFWKIVSLGEKRKKMNCHLCVKNSNFFVKGIFSSFFFIKFISKKLKQKEIERKGNISFFPFLKDIFFSFFSSTNYWYFEGVFCWFFFWGWGIFSVS